MELELKRLSEESVLGALEKAERYRDLNQPEETESICRDILAVSEGHQGALRILGLALTDQFPTAWSRHFAEAQAVFARLSDPYERVYYEGVAWERAAKRHVTHGEWHNAAASFHHALGCYAQAEKLAGARPDPVLRWNRCVRMVTGDPRLRDAVAQGADDDLAYGD
jgi:hypothetical protein